jgi:hypothetical protein
LQREMVEMEVEKRMKILTVLLPIKEDEAVSLPIKAVKRKTKLFLLTDSEKKLRKERLSKPNWLSTDRKNLKPKKQKGKKRRKNRKRLENLRKSFKRKMKNLL